VAASPRWSSPFRAPILGVLLVLPLLSPATRAATITVPVDASSVSEALAMTEPGDRVYVMPGSYVETETIVVPAGRTLTGAGRDAVQIQGPFLVVESEEPELAMTTTISRITFEQVGGSEWDAVQAEEIEDLDVHDCRFRVVGQILLTGGGRFVQNEVLFLDPYQFARLWVEVVGTSFIIEENVVLTSAEASGGWFGVGGDGAHLVVRHNTFVNPWVAHGAFGTIIDIGGGGGAVLTFTSNILFGNKLRCSGSAIERGYNAWTTVPGSASCQPDDTDIVAGQDTYFCELGDLDGFDWRLQPDSPCVGAGEGGSNIGAPMGVGCAVLGVAETPVPSTSPVRPIPNPSSDVVAFETVGIGSWTELRILDVAGRLVWRGVPQDAASGPRWPGTSLDGRPVSAGTYFARLTTDRGVVGARITRVE